MKFLTKTKGATTKIIKIKIRPQINLSANKTGPQKSKMLPLSERTKNLLITSISAQSQPCLNLNNKNTLTISLFVMRTNKKVMIKKNHWRMRMKAMRRISQIMRMRSILSHWIQYSLRGLITINRKDNSCTFQSRKIRTLKNPILL